MQFNKTPATIKQQIEILRQRGCIIDDEEYARKCLTNINYYRLAYYFAPFLERKGKYRDGTTFEQIMKVYDFDRVLDRMLMTYLEEIEISMEGDNLKLSRYEVRGAGLSQCVRIRSAS